MQDNIDTIHPFAQRVIDKCGGAPAVAKALGKTRSSVYRWTWAKEKGGTGGIVPAPDMIEMLERFPHLTSNDFTAKEAINGEEEN